MNGVRIRRVVGMIAMRVCPDIKAQGEALEDARKRANMLASRCGELEQKLRDVSEYNSSLSDQLSEAREAGESIQAQFDATMAELKTTRDTLGRSHVLSVEAQVEAHELREKCKKLEGIEKQLRQANHELILASRAEKLRFQDVSAKLRDCTQFMIDSIRTVRDFRAGKETIAGLVEYLESDLDCLYERGVVLINHREQT